MTNNCKAANYRKYVSKDVVAFAVKLDAEILLFQCGSQKERKCGKKRTRKTEWKGGNEKEWENE